MRYRRNGVYGSDGARQQRGHVVVYADYTLTLTSLNTAPSTTSATVLPYPSVRKESALAHRSGVFNRPSLSGSSPTQRNIVLQASAMALIFSSGDIFEISTQVGTSFNSSDVANLGATSEDIDDDDDISAAATPGGVSVDASGGPASGRTEISVESSSTTGGGVALKGGPRRRCWEEVLRRRFLLAFLVLGGGIG